jgi:hypothetical protein
MISNADSAPPAASKPRLRRVNPPNQRRAGTAFYNKNKTWCLGGFVVKIKAELGKRNNDKIIV